MSIKCAVCEKVIGLYEPMGVVRGERETAHCLDCFSQLEDKSKKKYILQTPREFMQEVLDKDIQTWFTFCGSCGKVLTEKEKVYKTSGVNRHICCQHCYDKLSEEDRSYYTETSRLAERRKITRECYERF